MPVNLLLAKFLALFYAFFQVPGQTPVGIFSNGVAPPPLSGMLVWWEADVGNNCSGVACTDGASQNTWADQSGSGNNGTLNFNPAIAMPCVAGVFHTNQINGKPAVTFNGISTDGMETCYSNGGTSGGVDNKSATTLIMVGKYDSGGTGGIRAAGGANSLVWNGGSSGGNLQVINQGSTANIGVNSHVGDANWHQLIVTYDSVSGAFAFRTDRAADGSGTNAKTISGNWLAIGMSNSGGSINAYNGQIAEFILYNRVLSAGEITTVETYLNAKYGL